MPKLLVWAAIAICLGCPLVAADDSATILLPPGLFQGAGAYGSLWQTQLAIHNKSSQQVQILNGATQCPDGCVYPGFLLGPGETTRAEANPYDDRLASRGGLILYIASRELIPATDVVFGFRIRDLSRNRLTAGTELPVVRATEFTSSPIELLNIPVDSAFRSTLRIYALDGDFPVARVRVYDFGTSHLLAEQSTALTRPGNNLDYPPAYYPAFAQIDNLTVPYDAGLGSITVEVAPVQQTQRLWAFVSITNNETQEVTMVTQH